MNDFLSIGRSLNRISALVAENSASLDRISTRMDALIRQLQADPLGEPAVVPGPAGCQYVIVPWSPVA